MEIKSKRDLDSVIEKLKEIEIIDKKELFLTIREKSYEFYISKGNLLEPFFSNLYFVFNDLEVEDDEEISKQINLLKNYYDKATLEEKFVVSNYIFRLELLNGNFHNAVKEYLERWMVIDLSGNAFNSEVRDFANFVLENRFDPDILLSVFKNFIDIDYFFSLDKKTRRMIFVNSLTVLWNSPSFFVSKKWLNLFDDLVKLINSAISKDLIEEQMYIHFFTYHVYGNSADTIEEWREFNKRVEKPASIFYKEWAELQNLPKCKTEVSKGKKKIAFLVDRVVWNSPNMVLYSLIDLLTQNGHFNKNYEIYLYSMEYVDKQEDHKDVVNSFVKFGINYFSPKELKKYGYYYSHIDKALILRDQILDDEIDYLIGGFGYDISNFLFSTRSAPKQIYWSHGNCTSEVENIDLRISHFNQECKESAWKLFQLPVAERFLAGNEHDKKEGKKVKEEYLEKFGKDTVILGSIGRLVKINNDDYLKAVAHIMKEKPNTIYLACGAGNMENIKKKIEKYGIQEERFIFTGMVNPHVFGWAIDLYLAPFPLPAGQALEEYRAKDGLFVTLVEKSIVDNLNKDDFLETIETTLENFKEYYQPYLEEIKQNGYLNHKNKSAKFFYTFPFVTTVEEYIDVALTLLNDSNMADCVSKESSYIYNLSQEQKKLNVIKQFTEALDCAIK